jgi:hypothetical protein
LSFDCGAFGKARIKAKRISDIIGFMIKLLTRILSFNWPYGVNCLIEVYAVKLNLPLERRSIVVRGQQLKTP